MDAGLAKVINSTIGTDSFKPLDKLLYGRQGLVPSDNAYFNISNFEANRVTVTTAQTNASAYSEGTIIRLKMWTDGGFKIGASVKYGCETSGNWTSSVSGGIAIFVNGVLVKKGIGSHYGELNGTLNADVKTDAIYFSTDDIVEIKSYVSGNRTTSGSGNVTFFGEINTSNPIVIYADSVEKPFDILRAE